MLEFCDQGFWLVVLLTVALTLPHLGQSPLGVVPQQNCRSQLIVNYTSSSVNAETVRLAPLESIQFGKALQRVVHAEPTYGPVYLAKIDIADGFYRIGLQPCDLPWLGVILPSGNPTMESLVAFPLALPMGWVERPPYFTSVAKTSNAALRRWKATPPTASPGVHRSNTSIL